jgi:hypothetical protein
MRLAGDCFHVLAEIFRRRESVERLFALALLDDVGAGESAYGWLLRAGGNGNAGHNRDQRGYSKRMLTQSAQPQRPPPHIGDAGIAHPSERGAATPTMPSRDSSFLRFVPSQAGQAAARSAVTNASNGLPQSRHSYSNSGISISAVSDDAHPILATATDAGRSTSSPIV